MSNFNISCPDCFNNDLQKFGFDPKTNLQKYRCKSCGRQFTLASLMPKSKKTKSKYPNCPICGASSYLHHDYLYYSTFTCNNKKCNHSFNIIKNSSIKNVSSDFIKAAFPVIKRVRTNINIIIDALYMYFVNNSSTRAISNFFKDKYNLSISPLAIYKWTIKNLLMLLKLFLIN